MGILCKVLIGACAFASLVCGGPMPQGGFGGHGTVTPTSSAAIATGTVAASFVSQPSQVIPSSVVPGAAQSSTAPAVASSSAVVSTGAGGSCSSSSPCTGDITVYDGTTTACGDPFDTYNDRVIALAKGMMNGDAPTTPDNPMCHRPVSIKRTDGRIIKAVAQDKCMGCVGTSIDLSRKIWHEVTDLPADGVGDRFHNYEWWFD